MSVKSGIDHKAWQVNGNIRSRNYWTKRLSGFQGDTYFFDNDYPVAAGDEQYAEYMLDVPQETADRIRGIAISDRAVHIVLLGALGVLAQKCSSVQDVAVYTAVYADNAGAGNFAEIPFRLDYSPHLNFEEVLSGIKQSLAQDLKHAEGANAGAVSAIGMVVNGLHPHEPFGAMPLDLVFSFTGEVKISLLIRYNLRKFSVDYIKRLGALYVALTGELIAGRKKPVGDIELINAAEKQMIIEQFNDTSRFFPAGKTVIDLFTAQVKKTPGHIAVQSGDRQISYGQLDHLSDNVANYLLNNVSCKGAVVAVQLERSADLMVAIFGILKAGCVYLPLSGSYPVERLKYMLRDSEAKILFTDPATFSHFEDITACVDIKKLLPGNTGPVNRTTPNDMAYIIYTSGSTGKPKGVMIRHRSVVNRLYWMQEEYTLQPDDVILQKTPIVFDVSIWELFWWSICGAKLVLAEPGAEKDPEKIARIIHDQQVTVLHFVPSMLNAFVNWLHGVQHLYSLKSIRHLFASGEQLNTEEAFSFLRYCPGARLHNLYGPTEATVDVSFHEVKVTNAYLRIPIGKPIYNTQLYIFNDHGQLQPIGIAGELYIGGENLAAGYLNQETLTKERFVTGRINGSPTLYRTGDLARWMPDGNIEYLGRIDKQVKIRGNRIEPGEIEIACKAFENVRNAVVMPVNAGSVVQLAAWIVAGKDFSEEPLRIFLQSRLPDYMIPSTFIRIDEIPLTVNGKADNSKLLSLYNNQSKRNYIPPQTDLQKKILLVWEHTLEQRGAGIKDNFFTSGGDSIRAIGLVYNLNTQLQCSLSIADLFDNATIELLARLISAGHAKPGEKDLFQVKKEVSVLAGRVLNSIGNSENIAGVTLMSDIQKGMIYHYETNYQDALYHDQMVYFVNLPGFDPALLRKVLVMMVEKHAILRTSFNLDRWEEFVQIVYKQAEPDYAHEDISALNKTGQEKYIAELMEKDKQDPFNYREAPLFRMRTLALGNNTVVVLFIFHHAILDGWSCASLMTEISNVYHALLKNPAYKPGLLGSDYSDFVLTELYNKKQEAAREFWKNELSGYKRLVLEFNDQPEEPVRQFMSEVFRFDPALVRRIDNRSAEWGISVKNICFSAYVLSMKLLTYENDITVGLVSNNRPEIKDGDKILGCFLNTIPFRIKVDKNDTYGRFVLLVNSKLNTLARYDKFPFYEIVRMAGENFHTDNPIYDVKFNYTNFHVYSKLENNSDVMEEYLSQGYERTNTLFDFNVDRFGENMVGNVRFSSQMVSGANVRTIIDYFEKMLHIITEKPEQLLNSRHMLPDPGGNSILTALNGTDADFDRTASLGAVFSATCSTYPHAVAVWNNGKALTYAELDRQSNQLAQLLLKNGVLPGAVVAIAVERSFEMVIGILAILKTGAAYLPVDNKIPQKRIEYILKECAVDCILVKNETGRFAAICNEIDIENGIVYKDQPAGGTGVEVDPCNVAYIIYTSGTTGHPKGIAIEHRSVVNRINWMQRAYPIGEQDLILQKTPFTFDVSVWELFWWMFTGAGLVMLGPEAEKEPEKIMEAIRKYRVSVMHFVPSMLSPFLNRLGSSVVELPAVSSLKYVFCSGEALSPGQVNAFNRLCYDNYGTKLVNLYGPTEATVDVTYYDCQNDHETVNVPIGKPIDNTRLYVLDKNEQLLPPGIKGELHIAGTGLARGYLNQPESTIDHFIDNPFEPGGRLYKTGDLVSLQANGNIDYHGRLDEQVKLRGNRIELAEIEQAVLKYAAITASAAIVKSNNDDARIVGFFTATEKISIPLLRDYLRTELPGYMIPAALVQIDEMPVTAHGKADKKKLKEFPEREVSTGGTAEEELPGEQEKLMLKLWCEVLDIAEVGLSESFFDAGGHSLNVLILMNRMEEVFGVKITLKEIFMRPTVKQLIAYINEKIAI